VSELTRSGTTPGRIAGVTPGFRGISRPVTTAPTSVRKTTVLVAFGCQVRDWSTHEDFLTFLNGKARPSGPAAWSFEGSRGEQRLEVQLLYTKDEFTAALDTPNAVVIYDGHSRYGRGPVFADAKVRESPDPATYPINPWDDHFRMGYDVVAIPCAEDILQHSTNPDEYLGGIDLKKLFASPDSKDKLAKSGGKHDCRDRYGYRRLADCDPVLADALNGRGQHSLMGRHFWYTIWSGDLERTDYMTFVNTGHRELDRVALNCDVLFMNSCYSKQHFYEALVKRKKATGSNCVFYLTNATCSAPTTRVFVDLLFRGYDPKDAHNRFAKDLTSLYPASGRVGFYE